MLDRAPSIRRPDAPDIVRVADSDQGSVSFVGYPVSLALFGEHSARLHKSSTG